MAVDLSDYVEQVKDKVNPPGINLFPNASDDEWARRLVGGFWDARIQGITSLDPFTSDEDGIITPQGGTGDDISRDMVQLIICWAAWTAVTNQMANVKSQFKGQAGPVSFEQQQSATVLKARMEAIREEKALVLQRLSDVGSVEVTIIDMVSARDDATYLGLTDWISGNA